MPTTVAVIPRVIGPADHDASLSSRHGRVPRVTAVTTAREFFQLKHRLLEFLATEMGFTICSIEANLPEAYRLNDYVLTGVGDPRQLLRGMYFWTWDTEEVLDMILWMRAFNASGRGRVQFTGFDMQTPTVAMEIVRAFVTRYDAPFMTTIARANDEIRALSAPSSFGVATGTFPVGPAAAKRVRYSGFIKTTGVTRGYAGLWWRVDGEAAPWRSTTCQTAA